ncbi:hypothetical protein GCM10011506_21700 [Marivirga lumbricoides]|uniref:BD-FAE-like domain-containing protein n=2 Tax=Marivirga lumbricoides TaxID=1046115 RepID=A0ABQ1ME46_9BACT|nr:hypothetical protein GCM10011506_21700 [Marivirga lumbricoides]
MLFLSTIVSAQEVFNLYPDEIPNSKASALKETGEDVIRNVSHPTLAYFKPNPEKANGTAIIIIPGGGYGVVVYEGEGVTNAKILAENGIAAFVLKYRLPDDQIMVDKKIGPLQDAQQAIKFVRENAAKFSLSKGKIGIMGFSAGGHLASTAATHFDTSYISNPKNTSLRPDFQILVYPVISMTDSLTHLGSRDALLGENPGSEDVKLYSNELKVTGNTPPAYLTHTADDKLVDVNNTIAYFQSLRLNNVDVEMHIYPRGGHGFIFQRKGWINPLLDWLKMNSYMK